MPIGPVFVAEGGFPYHRKPLQTSLDTEEVRQHLLELLQAMEVMPKEQHPAGAYVDERRRNVGCLAVERISRTSGIDRIETYQFILPGGDGSSVQAHAKDFDCRSP